MMRGTQIIFCGASVVALASACGSNDPPPAPPVEQAGLACTNAAQCYPNLNGNVLRGSATCLTKVTGGYCTHTCTADSDCCAVTGECVTNYAQVCAPFASTADMYCFLSCEASDMAASGLTDADAFCNRYAYGGFGCRSTGGGSKNRKICSP
jgi:hypothetical protein